MLVVRKWPSRPARAHHHSGPSLVWVQWVQLHPQILKRLGFCTTDFEEIWFQTLTCCTKIPFIFSFLWNYENLHPQFWNPNEGPVTYTLARSALNAAPAATARSGAQCQANPSCLPILARAASVSNNTDDGCEYGPACLLLLFETFSFWARASFASQAPRREYLEGGDS